MLHMVIVNHEPSTCAVVVPENRKKLQDAVQMVPETSKKLGVTVQGSWINAPAHTFYFMIDAPNAHVVNQLMTELHFMDWNTVTISPVITVQEAISRSR